MVLDICFIGYYPGCDAALVLSRALRHYRAWLLYGNLYPDSRNSCLLRL